MGPSKFEVGNLTFLYNTSDVHNKIVTLEINDSDFLL